MFLFVCLDFQAQGVETGISKDEFKIGESIKYVIQLKLKNNKDSVYYKPYENTIPARQKIQNSMLNTKTPFEFEIYSPFKDTLDFKNNIWIGRYEITIWDTGYFVIPPGTLKYQDSIYEIPALLVHVLLDAYDPKKDPIEITEMFEELKDETIVEKIVRLSKTYWYLYVILGILLLFLLIRKRYKKSEVKPIIHKEMSLKDRTLFAIDALDNRKLWMNDRLKDHYLELSSILRMYLTGRYKINFMEKTSSETYKTLQKLGLEKEIIATIRHILSHSDMVKYAKSEPEELDILKVSLLSKQVVAETSPLEFENE